MRCFLTPGSGIGFLRIPDPGSTQTHIFESLVTIFWVKSLIGNSLKIGPKFFLQHFKNKIIFNYVKFVATKKGMTTNFFPPLSFAAVFRSRIRDGSKSRSGIRDKHPGSVTLSFNLGSFDDLRLGTSFIYILVWVDDGLPEQPAERGLSGQHQERNRQPATAHQGRVHYYSGIITSLPTAHQSWVGALPVFPSPFIFYF